MMEKKSASLRARASDYYDLISKIVLTEGLRLGVRVGARVGDCVDPKIAHQKIC